MQQGGAVLKNPQHLPFKPFRAFMYTVKELELHDAAIYKFYMCNHDIQSTIFEAVHDHSIKGLRIGWASALTSLRCSVRLLGRENGSGHHGRPRKQKKLSTLPTAGVPLP